MMQVGNGSGVIGAKIGGAMKIVGIKFAIPNGGGSILFMRPQFDPLTMGSIYHDWTPGIPNSPTNVSEAWLEAKTTYGAAPESHLQFEQVEAF